MATHDTAECIWPLEAQLGEGAFWNGAEGRLHFVDIEGKALHSCDADGGDRQSLTMPGRPGFAFPTNRPDIWIVGMERALYLLGPEGALYLLHRLEEPPHNRVNDGMVDPSGALWFGTMDADGTRTTGRLYRLLAGELRATEMRWAITNGPAISPDGRTLYLSDSAERTIHRFDLASDPLCEGGEIWRQFRTDEGYPDGCITDSEGCVWVAMWDGGCVVRLDPDGRTIDRVALPCARPTKLAFGGTDMDQAFVTSARTELSAEQLAKQPLAGGVFRFTAPVRGLAVPPVQLD